MRIQTSLAVSSVVLEAPIIAVYRGGK